MDATSNGVENGHKYEENGHQSGAREYEHVDAERYSNGATCMYENGHQNVGSYENGHTNGVTHENGHTNGVACENGVAADTVAYGGEKGHTSNGVTYRNGHKNGEFHAIESRGGVWSQGASRESHYCINPIRQIEENQFQDVLATMRTDVEFIKLSIGDTKALSPHPAVMRAVKQVLESGGMCGYGHSCGLLPTRQAVAKLFSPFTTEKKGLTADDVVMASGCSSALDLAITVLSDPGQNILIPTPGFGLYSCQARARGLDCRFYQLVPDRSWEVDLDDLERQIDSNTAGIIINNPSNPCGSCYSEQHLKDILSIAEKYRKPIIVDETYAWMTFPGATFHPLSSLSHNVPILSCGSLAKRYLVPGWRIGWLIIHDRNNAFKDEVIPGLRRLAMKLIGPNTLAQAAVPDIFDNVPEEYHQQNLDLFYSNALHIHKALKAAPGLTPIMPSATMYLMVLIDMDHFPEFSNDVIFTRALVKEQSVFCLPGPAFNASGCFRIILICERKKIVEACQRITVFCVAHYKE